MHPLPSLPLKTDQLPTHPVVSSWALSQFGVMGVERTEERSSVPFPGSPPAEGHVLSEASLWVPALTQARCPSHGAASDPCCH
jgi:hypothetical protein